MAYAINCSPPKIINHALDSGRLNSKQIEIKRKEQKKWAAFVSPSKDELIERLGQVSIQSLIKILK